MKGSYGAIELDRSCMPIRHGEVPDGVRELVISFYGKRRSRISRFFTGTDLDSADDRSLLLVHEAMVLSGSYRRCLEPLKTILDRAPHRPEIATYVLARAGIAALEHGIPLDMGPIASGLGLNTGNRGRFQRGRAEDPMVELLKELLRALLLNERSSWVESEGYAKGLIEGSDQAFSRSLDLASQMARQDPDQGSYYELKCLHMIGRSLTSMGDYLEGKEKLAKVAEKAKELDFPALEMAARQDMGALSESVPEARSHLDRASELAMAIDNQTEGMRSRIVLDLMACREADLTSDGKSTIAKRYEDIVETSRDMMAEDPHFAMDSRANAALWGGRIDLLDEARDTLRGLLKDLRVLPDEDLEMKVRSIGVLVHMKAGDRTKAKRALLSLITKKPVKNHPEAYSILKEAVSDQEWLREDRDTKELFAEEPVYLLERSAAEEIIRRAKDAYPNEFGAMLRGIDRITHIEPVIEGAEGRSSFMFSMFNRFSQRMVEGEGVVHSHPSGAAYPSGADMAMFRTFPGINIIIGYPYTEDSMAAYDRLGNRVMLRIVPDSG